MTPIKEYNPPIIKIEKSKNNNNFVEAD